MRSRTIQPCRLSIHRGQRAYESKVKQYPNVYAFRVALTRHTSHKLGLTEDPKDQVNIPHPRLDFGVIDERMDLELLSGIAQARPIGI